MSFLKKNEDGAMLDPHVAFFKNFVLLLPKHERHFKVSGQDAAERGRMKRIESENGWKTLYLLYAKEEGGFKSRFYSI